MTYPQDDRSNNRYSGYGNGSSSDYPPSEYGAGSPGGYGQDYGQGYGADYAPDSASPAQPGLIAGRFVAKNVAINLIVLGVLAAAVTFAVVFLVDVLVSQLNSTSSAGVGPAVITGVIAGVVGVLAGLLYIPVAGTGNEHLFTLAVVALAIVAAVVWVLLGGLLDGDWTTLVTLAGIVCTAATAAATPSRIESAAVA